MAVAAEKLATAIEENSDRLLTCVHCGLCLPACPTYRLLGNENDSPRGRVYLMRAVSEGRLERGDSFIRHIDLCLGCRACETACPSGVPYGHLLEAARAEVSRAKSRRGSPAEFALRFILNQVFARPRVLRAAMAAARWLRDSSLARLAFDANLVGGRLQFALALLAASRSPFAQGKANDIDFPKAEKTARVSLLRGCVMEGLFAEANRATRRSLEINGCEVIEAAGQACCGALHSHAGQRETARRLARKNIQAFEESGCDWVITNAAGCGAAMKEYGDLMADDSLWAARARALSSRVRDISEFLIERGLTPPQGRINRRVAYDAPCHLLHAQRVAEAPLAVLKSITGIEIVPLRGSESCCGGAGIYNLQHADLSGEILSEKIENIKASGAEAVATGNPGCIMQIGAGARIAGLDIEVIHPIELLDAAYAKKTIQS
ncbi:MAG: heterodisulfide reductase-related iron-sulfur binding cluster [Acidobacteriota bacterium]